METLTSEEFIQALERGETIFEGKTVEGDVFIEHHRCETLLRLGGTIFTGNLTFDAGKRFFGVDMSAAEIHGTLCFRLFSVTTDLILDNISLHNDVEISRLNVNGKIRTDDFALAVQIHLSRKSGIHCPRNDIVKFFSEIIGDRMDE